MTAPLRQSEVITAAKKQSAIAGLAYAFKTTNGAWEMSTTRPETFRVCFTFTNGNSPLKGEVSPDEIGARA